MDLNFETTFPTLDKAQGNDTMSVCVTWTMLCGFGNNAFCFYSFAKRNQKQHIYNLIEKLVTNLYYWNDSAYIEKKEEELNKFLCASVILHYNLQAIIYM